MTPSAARGSRAPRALRLAVSIALGLTGAPLFLVATALIIGALREGGPAVLASSDFVLFLALLIASARLLAFATYLFRSSALSQSPQGGTEP